MLLPSLTLKLSLRLPPTCDPTRAARAVKEALEQRSALWRRRCASSPGSATAGWNAPAFAPWLEESITRASRQDLRPRGGARRHAAARFPSWACSGERFPRTQFFITGVLGPHSNAHGPNEFLHLDYAEKLTACVSLVLADHAAQPSVSKAVPRRSRERGRWPGLAEQRGRMPAWRQ